MENMTREEVINEIGLAYVEQVEKESVDFTNRVTDGTPYQGYTEFSATVSVDHDDWDSLTMLVFVETSEVEEAPELDWIDWDKAIAEAEYRLS